MPPFIRFLPVLLVLPLAGCTTAEPDMGMRSSAALLPQTTSSAAPVGVVLPPDAGSALPSTERNGPQSRLRRTVLRGDASLPGENFVSVETGGPGGVRPGLLRPPAAETLQAEMRAAMPGVPMRIMAAMEQNGSGPFGYAVGSSRRTSCLYAWQWLDFGKRGGFLRRHDPAGIRVRLCRQGQQTETLLRAVRAMRFAGPDGDGASDFDSSGWTGGDALAATGVPTSPVAADEMSGPSHSEETLPARRYRKARRHSPVPAPVRTATVAPAPALPTLADAPAIPLPGVQAPAPARLPAPPRRVRIVAAPGVVPPAADDDAPLIPDPGITAATR